MITIIYNHKEKSMREQFSTHKGMLGYNKEDKTFACEASDLDCAGVKDLPHAFTLKIEENGHTMDFIYKAVKHTEDEDHEIESWLYQSRNGFNFIVFND